MRAGDVILLFDGTIRLPKHKRFICVVAADGWFLRINSERHFRPHLLITVRDNRECLDHDSFVELRGVIEHDIDDITNALGSNDARLLGRLSDATANALIAAVRSAPTFTVAESACIVESLKAAYGFVV